MRELERVEVEEVSGGNLVSIDPINFYTNSFFMFGVSFIRLGYYVNEQVPTPGGRGLWEEDS